MRKRIDELLKENRLILKTMIVFSKAERTIRSREYRAIKENNLTPTQFAVLETLYSKGNLRIQDLIDKMLATSGNMTVVIKNMERDGWIFRTADPNDGRAFLVGLTPAGRDKVETILPDHIESVKNALSVLTEEDQEDLIRILKKFKKIS